MSNSSCATDLVKPFLVFKLYCVGNLSVNKNSNNEEKKIMEERIDRLIKKVIDQSDRSNKSTIMAALFERGLFVKGVIEVMKYNDTNSALQFDEAMKFEKDIFISGILMRRFKEYDRCISIMYETSYLTLDIMILVFSNKTERYYELIKRYLTDLQLHGICKAEHICNDTMKRSTDTNATNMCPVEPTRSIRQSRDRKRDDKIFVKQDAVQNKNTCQAMEPGQRSAGKTCITSGNDIIMDQVDVARSKVNSTKYEQNDFKPRNKKKGENFNEKEIVKLATPNQNITGNIAQNLKKTLNRKESKNELRDVKPPENKTECTELFSSQNRNSRRIEEMGTNNCKEADGEDSNNEEVNTLILDEEIMWPELLMKTQIWSANIEMIAINIGDTDSNWLLKDSGYRKTETQDEEGWQEGCDRLFYNPITKLMQVDRDGPVFLYCGRQHCHGSG